MYQQGRLHTPIYGETMYQQGRLTHSDLWRDYQQGRLTHAALWRNYVPAGETYALRSMERLCTSRGDLRTPIYGKTMYQQGRLTYSDLWRDYVPAGETYALRSMERLPAGETYARRSMEKLCTSRGDLRTPIYGETVYQQGRLTHSDLWRDYVSAGETYTLRSMERLCTSRGDLRTPIYFAPMSCVEAVVGSESMKQALQTTHRFTTQDAWELSWPRDNFSWSMFNVPITATTHDVSLYVFIHYGFRTLMYVRYNK